MTDSSRSARRWGFPAPSLPTPAARPRGDEKRAREPMRLKTPREIALMREAGLVVTEALEAVKAIAVIGATTAQFNDAVADVFARHGATPLFLGYPNPTKGKPPFPAVICSSVNEQVVHGVPNHRPLREGDIVSVDTGCRLNGWCGDAAITVAIGPVAPEIQKLLDVTKETLHLAIRAMERCTRWSEVALLMERYVKGQGMYVIEQFVGHGIGQSMHEEPQVPNFVNRALRQNDFRLEPGLVIAVEPMVALGTKEVVVLDDGWTVVTKDRRPSAHYEHTVAMTPEGPQILTPRAE